MVQVVRDDGEQLSLMSGRCVELREMSPGGREMATSGGEREERRAWTHDTRKSTFKSCSN